MLQSLQKGPGILTSIETGVLPHYTDVLSWVSATWCVAGSLADRVRVIHFVLAYSYFMGFLVPIGPPLP
jgi:hypothetical protein